MRFEDLELFVAVVDEGNFSSAARRLNLSQPAVSARIAHLERELATALVIREARRIAPTASGKVLYAEAQRMLCGLEEIKQRIQQEESQPVGPLVLAAGEASGVYLAPLLLGGFKQMYPRVQPRLNIQFIAATLSDILDQRVNLGIVPVVPEDPRLEVTPLCEDEFVLIVPADHPLAERDVVAAAELPAFPLLTREREARTNSILERALEPLGVRLSDMNVLIEMSSNEALKVAVSGGIGMAFVSRLGLHFGSSSFRVVRVDGLQTRRVFNLVRRTAETGSYAEQLFWDYCRSESVLRDVAARIF